jgi:1,4-alpha-glucan branching enzyme
VVAAYDAGGRLVRATGVQNPGVLDRLYADAADARLGPTWRGHRARLAVWAPTAKKVGLLISLNGLERHVAMRRGDDGVWRVKGRRGWRGAAYAYEVTVYVPTLVRVETNVVTDP